VRINVAGLRVTRSAKNKLARRGIEEWEPLDVGYDRPRFFRNKKGRAATYQMIGSSEAGRILTILIVESNEPGDWDVVNGWVATSGERTRYERQAG
jgi:hypothetical protein